MDGYQSKSMHRRRDLPTNDGCQTHNSNNNNSSSGSFLKGRRGNCNLEMNDDVSDEVIQDPSSK
ncbi:unnamed protein product, partial [Sphenostylis stenocarpa]